MHRRGALLALAGALAVGSLTGLVPTANSRTAAGTVVADTVAAAPSISWKRCGQARLRAVGAQCGMLAVPLNHADPGGRQIKSPSPASEPPRRSRSARGRCW